MKKKIIKWFLFLLWACIIFMLSNEADSSQKTQQVIEQVVMKEQIKEEQENNIDTINFLVRKTAHMTEYFILTLLVVSLLKEYPLSPKKTLIFSLVFGIIYAIGDEIHQYFIPGRSALFTDVLIDSCGCLIGIILILFLIKRNKISLN